MSIEIARVKVRMDALEATRAAMVETMQRIETMYDTAQARHEVMMQEKADSMRDGTIAEIRGNVSVLRRELLQELKTISKSAARHSS